MAKIEVTSNTDELIKEILGELENYQKNMQFTVFRALTLLEAEVMQNIRIKSGLKVRSGMLLNSISRSKRVEIKDDGSVEGTIGPEGVPYAAIHEFGGTTGPHQIFPRNASVLSFMSKGQRVFAKFVNHPGSKIPARPYLAPALEAKKDEILKNFGILIQASFTKKG